VESTNAWFLASDVGRQYWDGLKIRIITYAKDRQTIDFSTIAGNTVSAFP
jgi:hypothetical protein